jgi:ABC-type multidrug transport system fused ATPase/permease subunit
VAVADAGAARDVGPGTLAVSARLLRLTLPGHGFRLVAGLTVLLTATAATLLQPWPLKLVVDSVLADVPPPTFVPLTSRAGLLAMLCVVIVALQILVGSLTAVGTTLLVGVGLRLVFRLRCILFAHVEKLSLAFHDATTVGDSLYRVTWDSYAAQTLVNGAIVPAITASLTLVGIGAVMMTRDWILTLAACGIAVPVFFLIRCLDRPLTTHSLEVHARESDVSTRIQETLGSIRAVQAFGRENEEHARFERHAAESVRANLRLTVLQSAAQAVVGLLMAAGTAMVVGIAAARALQGRLTAGDVVLIVGYLVMLYKPLETLAYIAVAVQGAAAGARRVFTLLDAPPEVADAPNAISLSHRARGHVVFERVSFAYREDEPVLRDVSLELRPGEVLALVGSSGAGKTTLASLLLRFYDPTVGHVTLDGQDLRALTLRSLRAQIAVVLQEPVLFAATIRENIAYGRPQATVAEIEAAALAAGAHDFIAALPDGYSTRIGERGVTLSGGERQRLSIARAFVKDTPILVLDEPTSAVDAETEHTVVTALDRLVKDRTTLIIAHRLSTVRRADRIAVMSDGTLVETGTHAELISRGKMYARLHALQSGTPSAGR